MKPFVICIDGLIGAGKSSLMNKLANDYNCFPEPIAEWNLLSLLYQNPKNYGFPFQLQVLVSQFKQQNQFPQDVVLVERSSWTSRYIFAPLLLDETELDLYDQIYRKLAYSVDYFIYLDIKPSEAHERIQHRSEVDQQISLDYLELLYDRYQSILIGADIVDATLCEEEVERQVRALIHKKIKSLETKNWIQTLKKGVAKLMLRFFSGLSGLLPKFIQKKS